MQSDIFKEQHDCYHHWKYLGLQPDWKEATNANGQKRYF
jgi:hypothetical protein